MFFVRQSTFLHDMQRLEQRIIDLGHRLERLEEDKRRTFSRPVMYRDDLTSFSDTVLQRVDARFAMLHGLLKAHKIKDRRVDRALQPPRRSGVDRRGS